MKRVLFLSLNVLRKAAIVAFLSITVLSLSSCATIIDSLLGNSTCIYPGCDRETSGHKAYCILHSEMEPVEVDTKTPYKLHKPMSDDDMKTKIRMKKSY